MMNQRGGHWYAVEFPWPLLLVILPLFVVLILNVLSAF
jgi:hypothetical protein